MSVSPVTGRSMDLYTAQTNHRQHWVLSAVDKQEILCDNAGAVCALKIEDSLEIKTFKPF